MVLAQMHLFLALLFLAEAEAEAEAASKLTAQFLVPHNNLVQLMMEELEATRIKKLQLDAKIFTAHVLQLVDQTLALKFLRLLQLNVGVQMELTRELKQFN
jgi:hypothetical protein